MIVPTHRGAHRLPILLAALEAQDLTERWELVVVVDGRDPETEAVVEHCRDRFLLRVVIREQSVGVAAALNAGYAAATGRVLVRCDDDLTPAPDMLRRHVDHHRRAEPVGVIGLTRDVFPRTPYARAYGRPANLRALAAAYARPAELRWMSWAAHNSLTRESWQAVGGFEETFAYREDSDLGLRLAEHGIMVIIDPALEIEHRGPASDTQTRASRAWVSGASEVLFAQRHPGTTARGGGSRTVRQHVWSMSTMALSAVIRDRAAAARVGRSVDRILEWLPTGLRGHAVAMVVEGAARSGRSHGSTDQRAYQVQKDAELTAEQRAQG